jgi:hypothetical protein
MREYEPEPLSAPIALIRANEQLLSHLALDLTLGWKDVAKSEVRVLIIPGSHTTITMEPLVRQLAKTLSEELDAAESVATARRRSATQITQANRSTPNRLQSQHDFGTDPAGAATVSSLAATRTDRPS